MRLNKRTHFQTQNAFVANAISGRYFVFNKKSALIITVDKEGFLKNVSH